MSAFVPLLAERLRRDRVQLALWILGAAALATSATAGVSQAYGSEQDRQVLLATVMAERVILFFRGLPSGANAAAFAMFLILPFLVFTVALMSTFLAVRHTRGEEESGRSELVAATAAGRVAPAVATLVEGLAANAAAGLAVVVALAAAGYPAGGSWVAGAATGAAGVAFLGVGLVVSQVMPTSRAANATAVWIVVGTYLLAGLGNALGQASGDLQRLASAWPVWLSPFGWAEQSRPFADDAVAPVVLCVAVGVALAGGALLLQRVRDVGTGLIPERPGRADARPSLSSPIGLVARLTVPALAGWMIGGAITGALATSLSAALRQAAGDIPSVQAVIEGLAAGGTLEQGAVTVFFTMVGVLAACCGVQTVCRARQEEARGTAEPVLSTPVGRVRWFADYLVVAALGVVAVVVAAALGAAAGLVAQSDPHWSLMTDVLVAGGGQAVAASVFVVVTAVVFVTAPRLTIPVGWTLVLAGTMLGLFGPLFGLPEAVVHLAPLADAPLMSGDDIDVRGLGGLVAVVAAGAVIALRLMRRRELAPAG